MQISANAVVARLLIYSLLHQNDNRKKPQKADVNVNLKKKECKNTVLKCNNMH